MNSFTAEVIEDARPNRLLSLAGGNGMPKIAITKSGGNPDFRSTGPLTADTEINVEIKNNPIWGIEAGADLTAGSYVETGAGGVIVASDSTGIGYVATAVKKGEIAQLVRKAGGGGGEKGPKGDKGETGPAGPKGATGAAGKDGAAGAKGEKGDTGAKGATGAAGKDGFGTEAQYNDIITRLDALEAAGE